MKLKCSAGKKESEVIIFCMAHSGMDKMFLVPWTILTAHWWEARVFETWKQTCRLRGWALFVREHMDGPCGESEPREAISWPNPQNLPTGPLFGERVCRRNWGSWDEVVLTFPDGLSSALRRVLMRETQRRSSRGRRAHGDEAEAWVVPRQPGSPGPPEGGRSKKQTLSGASAKYSPAHSLPLDFRPSGPWENSPLSV